MENMETINQDIVLAAVINAVGQLEERSPNIISNLVREIALSHIKDGDEAETIASNILWDYFQIDDIHV